MSHDPSGERPNLKSAPNENYPRAPASGAHDLPAIPSNSPAASQNEPPKPPSVHGGVSMRPTPPPSSTPPEQRISRPIGVENLLNPAAGSRTNMSSRRQEVEKPALKNDALLAPNSRPATPSMAQPSARKSSAGEVTLPSITPPLRQAYPPSISRSMTPRSPTNYGPALLTMGPTTGTIDARQSPFVLPREQAPITGGHGASGPTAASQAPIYGSSAPSLRPSPRMRQASLTPQAATPYPRMQTLLDPAPTSAASNFSASRSSSPSLNEHRPSIGQGGSTGQPQSFFASSFNSSGPASSMPPMAFDKVQPNPQSLTPHSQYQLMTLETESGPIQVPVDVQAASKVADEKRKRNATASHRFRQRRKEKEQETSNNISKLEAQARELAEERDFYQSEKDFFQELAARNRIPIPPRPASPRRRRAELAQYQDSDSASRDGGRNMRRRTSSYVPAQGSAPAVEQQAPPMPSFERVSGMPSEHVQMLQQQRVRPHGGPFPPNANPFDPNAPR